MDAELEIERIFESMAEAKLSDEQFKKIFFSLSEKSYLGFLPKSLTTNIDFIKEATVKGLFLYQDLPSSLQNKEFITKGLYIKMLSSNTIALNENIYPQDEEIGLSLVENKAYAVGFSMLNEELRNNKNFIIKAVKKKAQVFSLLNVDIQEELAKDKKLMIELIKESPRLYLMLSDEYKLDKEILLSMLKSDEGYDYIKNYNFLNKSHDKDVILYALENYSDAHKHIHQRYVSAIKKNNAKANSVEFMKSYFLAKELDNSLPISEVKPKSNKI